MKNKVLLCVAMSLACFNGQATEMHKYAYIVGWCGMTVGCLSAIYFCDKYDESKKESLRIKRETEKLLYEWHMYTIYKKRHIKADGSSILGPSQRIRQDRINDGTVYAITYTENEYSPIITINECDASKSHYYKLLRVCYDIAKQCRRMGSEALEKKFYKLMNTYKSDKNDPNDIPEYYNHFWWERSKIFVDKFEALYNDYIDYVHNTVNPAIHRFASDFDNKSLISRKKLAVVDHRMKRYGYAIGVSVGLSIASMLGAFLVELRNSA